VPCPFLAAGPEGQGSVTALVLRSGKISVLANLEQSELLGKTRHEASAW
jgi:hypothetical protein